MKGEEGRREKMREAGENRGERSRRAEEGRRTEKQKRIEEREAAEQSREKRGGGKGKKQRKEMTYQSQRPPQSSTQPTEQSRKIQKNYSEMNQ